MGLATSSLGGAVTRLRRGRDVVSSGGKQRRTPSTAQRTEPLELAKSVIHGEPQITGRAALHAGGRRFDPVTAHLYPSRTGNRPGRSRGEWWHSTSVDSAGNLEGVVSILWYVVPVAAILMTVAAVARLGGIALSGL